MASRSNDPTSVQEIAARLALTRRALNLTQSSISRLMGSAGDGQAWQNYEAGRRRISIDHANKLVRSLGLSFDWIYQGQLSTLPPDLRERIQQLMIEDAGGSQSPPTTRRLRR